MSIERLIYLIVITATFGIGLYVYKYNRVLNILVGIVGLGLLAEYIVEINKYIDISNEPAIYNLYIPLEYFLYTAFFYLINTNRYLKKAILISIPLFIISILLFYKFSTVSFSELRMDVYVFSGILTMTWSIWTLFIMQPIEQLNFKRHPLIWICAGLIIFYSGNTPFNLGFDSLNSSNPELLKILSVIIQKGLNIFLYITFSVGFLYSNRMRNYGGHN